MKNILTEALVNSATNASFICSYTNSAKLRTHPSARISRSISFDVIGICVLLAQLLYQDIRAYAIRIIAKRINEKKEVNPSLKYRVYM